MPNVLEDIIIDTRKAIEERKQYSSAKELDNALKVIKQETFFYDSLLRAPVPAIIAEVKEKSPSHGDFRSKLTIEERVRMYIEAGADAISYVSNRTFFGGQPKFIKQVKQYSSVPVLQKDFVIDEYQIKEAAVNGADALLLIARLVDMETLRTFVTLCKEYKMEPVLELFNEEDLLKAQETTARVYGVNARNLDTLDINKENAYTLLKKIPTNKLAVGFSGVETKEDVENYMNAGARAVLIGSQFMKSNKSIKEFIIQLR